MDWNPYIPGALASLLMIFALFAPDIWHALKDGIRSTWDALWHRRFFSPERKRLQDVTAWWQERAR